MTDQLDVVIIGAGTAGLSALRAVRSRTERFAIVNDGPYGTTCARVGCMPSKALIEVANAFHQRRHFSAMGIRGGDGLTVDRPAVLRHVRALRDRFVRGVLDTTAALGERSISGRARFVEPNMVAVNGRHLRAKHIVIATGSRPVVPDEWRSLGDAVLTTDTLFEREDLPPRMAVVGLGAVGAEAAQALSRLGIAVTAFEAADRVAGLTDPMVNHAAVESLRAELDVVLGAAATITRTGRGLRLSGGTTSVEVDQVLVAMGRRPNLDDLGLDRLGIELDDRGLPPFDPRTMQIGDLPIYIAGDANAAVPLLHEAADEGFIAGYNAARGHAECFERRTPLAIVFTSPNVAVAGRPFGDLTEAEAVIGEVDFGNQGRLRMSGRNRGCLRLYAARDDGRLLGVEICAPEGEHLVHLIAFAIQRGLTVRDFLRLPFYHPVVEEGVRTALRDAAAKLPGVAGPDLAACGRLDADALE